MSLEGNLEELGLGEILQIVSLSKKTGVLSLSSKGRDGSVFFRQGLVVRATSSYFQQSLGEVLIQKGFIDLALLRKALTYQQEHGFRERLAVILVKNFALSQDAVAYVVREHIENIVFSLSSWREGTFRFIAQESFETVDDTKMDPLQFMLDQGLNPMFLAMEGSRRFDENHHAGDECPSGSKASDASVGCGGVLRDAEGNHALPQRLANRPIVVVDDDGPTLRIIADGLSGHGFVVHALTSSEDTLKAVNSLCQSGEQPALLIDLIMPKMDGSGVLGGLELLERIRNDFSELPLFVMSDYHHADAEKMIADRGCYFVVKPRRGELKTTEITDAFLTRVAEDIRACSTPVDGGTSASRFNLGDELRVEMGEHDVHSVDSAEASDGHSLLFGMLEELKNPDLQGGVMLLVLRFASQFLNRAVLFTVDRRIIFGFGQFGVQGSTVNGDERVRSIHFSQGSGSMFDESFHAGRALTFSPTLNQINAHVFDQLGNGVPAEVYIAPLISRTKVIGFLYGDNLPDRTPIGDVEPLTFFLSQAGITMEKHLSECQLSERGKQ